MASAYTLALLTVPVAAQTARVGDVIARLDSYLLAYEERLANVVAEETYRQWAEEGPTYRRWSTSGSFARTLH